MIIDIPGPTFQKGQKVKQLGYEDPDAVFTISGRFWDFDKQRWNFTLLEEEAKDEECLINYDLLEAFT